MKLFRMAIVVTLMSVMVMLHTPFTAAYTTGPKWKNIDNFTYYLDPNLNSKLQANSSLSVTNAAGAVVSAASTWNTSSAFRLTRGIDRDSSNAVHSGIISAVNFAGTDECGPYYQGVDISDVNWAIVCSHNYTNDDSRLYNNRMSFNSSPRYDWNTNGTMNDSDTNNKVSDVRVVALHELGHFFKLEDRPANEANGIMSFFGNRGSGQGRWNLWEDDKQGATQIYGPETGFESYQAQGIIDNVDMNYYVNGYFNNSSPPPELGPKSGEFNVPVQAGSKYERIAGYATNARSYAYLRLFTSDCISAGVCYDANTTTGVQSKLNGVTIIQGMKLRWYQYNHQQSTMSVDFLMTDGTAMRNYTNVVDTAGRRVHPAFRGAYGTGHWFYVEVDLSPLAGKKIRQWWIAYDNGNNGVTGQFRGYFDQIAIVHPY